MNASKRLVFFACVSFACSPTPPKTPPVALVGRLEILQVKPFQPVRTRVVNVRIRLAQEETDSVVRVLASALRDSIAALEPAMKAMRIFFYGPHSVGDAAFDVAKAEWAPEGDPAKAGISTAPPTWRFEFAPRFTDASIDLASNTALGGVPLPRDAKLLSTSQKTIETYEGLKVPQATGTYQSSIPPTQLIGFYWAAIPKLGFKVRRGTYETAFGFCKPGVTGRVDADVGRPGTFAVSLYKDPGESCRP